MPKQNSGLFFFFFFLKEVNNPAYVKCRTVFSLSSLLNSHEFLPRLGCGDGQRASQLTTLREIPGKAEEEEEEEEGAGLVCTGLRLSG